MTYEGAGRRTKKKTLRKKKEVEITEGELAIKFMKMMGNYLINNFPKEVKKDKKERSPVVLAISIMERLKTFK